MKKVVRKGNYMKSFLKNYKKKIATAFLVVAVAAIGTSQAAAPISLGTAANFAILGGSGVTNADSSTFITGNVGSSPTPAVTGLTAAMVDGILYLDDANSVTASAHADLITAYNAAAGATGGVQGPNDTNGLGGATLAPGVYTYDAAAPWSDGNLTLDGQGNPNAQWIFQIGTALTTPADAKVLLINGASANHVFWQMGSSLTLGANNAFAGNILAHTSITLGGGTLNGRALAITGAVTISVAAEIITVLEPATGNILVYKVTMSGTSARFEAEANEPNGWLLEKGSASGYLVLDVNNSDPNILNDVQYIDYYTEKVNNKPTKMYEIWIPGEDFAQSILPGRPPKGKNITTLNVDLWNGSSFQLTGWSLGTASLTDIGTRDANDKKTKVDVAASLKGSYWYKSGENLNDANEILDEQGTGTLTATLDAKWTKIANDPCDAKGFGGNIVSFLDPNSAKPKGFIYWLKSTGYKLP
jgi:hypothetical protein